MGDDVAMLEFDKIQVHFGKAHILKGVTVAAEDGKITGIIGPNGSGKSTLIKTFFSIVPYQEGNVFLNGRNIRKFSPKEVARQVGYVGQETACLFDFKVREVIAMGRFPHTERGSSRQDSEHAVEKAISVMHLEDVADRSIQSLSGGERKMVYLARAIAQGTDNIILDEPTNHLDIRHQLFILDYLKKSGKTVLIVLHDLTLASLYCDTLYLLKNGQNVTSGKPQETLNRENVWNVFGVSGSCRTDEAGKCRFQLD